MNGVLEFAAMNKQMKKRYKGKDVAGRLIDV